MRTFTRFIAFWLLTLAALGLFTYAGMMTFSIMKGTDPLTALKDHGRETTGTIIDLTMAVGTTPGKNDHSTPATYYVSYKFTDEIGSPHQGMTNGTGPTFARFAPGQEITIRYLPEQPDVNIYVPPSGAMPGTSVPYIILVLMAGVVMSFGAIVSIGLPRQRLATSRA